MALGASAQQYEVNTLGCTNNVPNNSTTTADLGSAIGVTKSGEVGLQVAFGLTGAGTTACNFKFATSLDGTTYDVGKHTITLVPAGTATVNTNLTVDVGAAGYLKLISITAANNSAAMTNIVVKYSKKPTVLGGF